MRQARDLGRVVADQDDDAPGQHLELDQLLGERGSLRIECGGRLIEQQHARLIGDGADEPQTLTEGAERERAAIEARIALGATRFEAFAAVLRRAIRTAITPLLNTMSVAGIVTLPGMMTGQILAGADPAEAAKYQIMIMFVLTGAAGFGALAAAFGGVLLLTDARHRLRLDRLGAARA